MSVITKLRNPYLDAFNKYVVRDSSEGWPEWRERTTVSPDEYRTYSGPAWERYMDETSSSFTARRYLTRRCAWAVPSTEAIMAIAELKMPVVEIGAGNGYWAWLLRQVDVEVVAFDATLNGEDNNWCECDFWSEVLLGGHEELPQRSDHALMLCWPYINSMAIDCLHSYSGDRLIYIGESESGCCASDEFFEEVEEKWSAVREIAIPQWPGSWDSMTIYERLAVIR